MRPLCLIGLLAWALVVTGVQAQVEGDPGVFRYGDSLVQLQVTGGEVGLTSAAGDAGLDALAAQVQRFIERAEEQEFRELGDQEAMYRGTSYARKLVEKTSTLLERTDHLGEPAELAESIVAAAQAFDVTALKAALQQKVDMEDDNLAEAAYQLGSFQELDGEYQDAWGNYQRASNLEPDNQLYMDAHGKNEF